MRAAVKIDTHHHFWSWKEMATRPTAGLIAEHLKCDFTPADLAAQMRRTGVDAVVVVQAAETLDETRMLLGTARQHPWVVGVVGWIDMRSEAVEAQVEEFCDDPAFKGVRFGLFGATDGLPDDRAFSTGMRALENRALTFDALVRPNQLPMIGLLAAKFPGVRFVVNHMGYPPTADSNRYATWLDHTLALATLDNVAYKLSGFWLLESHGPLLATIFGAGAQPATRAQTLVALADSISILGPQRCLWGSDWPHCNHSLSYDAALEVVEMACARDKAVADAILGETARLMYGLEDVHALRETDCGTTAHGAPLSPTPGEGH
jgi:L-fuconolactonase